LGARLIQAHLEEKQAGVRTAYQFPRNSEPDGQSLAIKKAFQMSDAATVSHPLLSRLARRPALVLLILCTVLWLPGILTLPPLDRDESRFAQASKQMLETGDLIDIRFGAGTRYNKPVGIYWLQSASAALLGDSAHDRIPPYRIPSWIGGYLALLLTYACARCFARRETALAAAALLATSVAMAAEAQIATTDAALLAATLGAEYVLFRIYLAARDRAQTVPQWPLVAFGWFSFACGVLVKGPVIAGVLAVTALAVSLWDRDWRWLKKTRPLLGLAIAALVVLPWMIAIYLHTQGAFYRQSLGHDFASKLVSGQESHGAPPGYYLLLSTLTLWPAVLFVLPGIYVAWLRRGEPALRYLLAWIAAAWLMFELVPTKLPHYILPAYPPLAMLAAFGALESIRSARAGMPVLKYVAVLQFAVGAIAFVGFALYAPQRLGSGLAWNLFAPIAAGLVCTIAAMWAYFRDGGAALPSAIVAAAIFELSLVLGVAPRLSQIWLSPGAAERVAKERRLGDPPTIISGYVEPSLIFLLGTQTRIATGADAAHIAAQEGGLALIEDRERNGFLSALDRLNVQAYPVDQLSGLDYSRGRKMHITLYRVLRPVPAK